MKTEAFQDLLLKSAVSVVACDGNIDETEISEIRNMAENEIYFMGYDFEEPLANNLKNLKETVIDLNPKVPFVVIVGPPCVFLVKWVVPWLVLFVLLVQWDFWGI